MVRKLLIILCIAVLAGCATTDLMREAEETADSKPVSQLTALGGAPADTDQFFINDSGISKSVTALNVIKMLETDRSMEVHPNNLPADGQKSASFILFDDSEDVSTGDGAGDLFWRVPSILNGWNIVEVAAAHQTAGTGTGSETTDIQVYRKRLGASAVAVLTTEITIDEDDTDSSQAAASYSINTSNDDLATGDLIWFYVTGVTSGAPKGLLTELIFKKP
jgi:hypothetical protein